MSSIDEGILDIDGLEVQVVVWSSATYWLSPPAAEVGRVKGLDFHTFLTRRPQPGVVVV